MKPTVARRFSHWDNVPTLHRLHSQPILSSLDPKCPSQSSSCFSVQLSPDVAQPVSSSSGPCRSLTSRAGGRFCGTMQDSHPVPTARQGHTIAILMPLRAADACVGSSAAAHRTHDFRRASMPFGAESEGGHTILLTSHFAPSIKRMVSTLSSGHNTCAVEAFRPLL